MSGIHDDVLNVIKTELVRMMITEETDSRYKVGIIQLGPLQGSPDPDVARISITLHENDPDQFISGAPTSQDKRTWEDDLIEVEIGGAITWNRKFVLKARCLLDLSRENLEEARDVASTVRTKLEHNLLLINLYNVDSYGEKVSRGIVSTDLHGEMIQSGGPPDSYDYLIKIQFGILTTRRSS